MNQVLPDLSIQPPEKFVKIILSRIADYFSVLSANLCYNRNMNQKERMLANLPYKAWLDGLSEERSENAKRIYEYNNLPPIQTLSPISMSIPYS